MLTLHIKKQQVMQPKQEAQLFLKQLALRQTSDSSRSLFANNTNLFLHDISLSSLEFRLNLELENLSTWFKVKKLSFNLKKTNYMIFWVWFPNFSYPNPNPNPRVRVNVIENGAVRQTICDFILVLHCTYSSILYHFRVI